MQFAKLSKQLGCQSKQRFERLMIDTLKMQQSNLSNLLQFRGACFSLFALDSVSHLWKSNELKDQVRSNLKQKSQHLNDFYFNLLQKHYPNDSQLEKKYSQLKWPSDTTFKINNKTIIIKDIEDPNNTEGRYDRLLLELPPNQQQDEKSNNPMQQNFKTVYVGQELGYYVKSIFTEQNLHFKNNKFYLKFNDKLVNVCPPNIMYNYVVRSKDSSLQLELIDLPSIYSVEDVNMRKSIDQLEQILKAANFLNIFTKLRYLRDFTSVCPKCTGNQVPGSLPIGYLSILTQDPDLHSDMKAKYMLSRIWKACHQNSRPENYLVVVGDEYSGEIKEGLKKALKGQLDFSEKDDELAPIRKRIMDNLSKFSSNDMGTFLKKAVLLELLYESNTEITIDMFKELDQKIANNYLEYLKEYNDKLELSALNPSGDAELDEIFKMEQCPGLELIFGSNKQQIKNQYEALQIEKVFQNIDSRVAEASKNREIPSGKIKPNKDNL